MSQYFTLINHDREEYANLPSAMAPKERITDAKSMGMVGYLLLDGPMDGTSLTEYVEPDHPRIQEEIEQLKKREIERELKRFSEDGVWEKYIERARDQARYDDDMTEDVIDAAIEHKTSKKVAKWCKSSYRDRDGYTWDQDALVKTAASFIDIDEYFEYAGRWAGDRIALVGDYAEGESEGWYEGTKQLTIVELPNGNTVALRGIRELRNKDGSKPYSMPISVDDIPKATEPGDYIEVSAHHHEGDERVLGEVVTVEDAPYENITAGLTAEFEAFVGEDWLENTDQSVLAPDMVVSN